MPATEYTLGRLGGARSRLLATRGLDDLLSRPGLSGRLDALRSSVWGRSLPPPAPGPGPDVGGVEEALAGAFHREMRRLVADLGGAPGRLFAAFLLIDDAASLKGPMRAIARGLKPQHASRLLEPSPSLDREALLQLAGSPDAAAAAGLLSGWGSPFAAAVAAHAAEIRTPGGLLRTEVAIDRAAFEAVRRAARGPGEDRRVLRRLAAVRADLVNAATLLAVDGQPETEDLCAPGGERIDAAAFARMAVLSGPQLAGALATSLQDLLGAPSAAALQLAAPLAADHLLGRALARVARAEARRSPLSLAVPCAWAVELLEEMKRVRLILRGTELGFPPARLADLLEA